MWVLVTILLKNYLLGHTQHSLTHSLTHYWTIARIHVIIWYLWLPCLNLLNNLFGISFIPCLTVFKLDIASPGETGSETGKAYAALVVPKSDRKLLTSLMYCANSVLIDFANTDCMLEKNKYITTMMFLINNKISDFWTNGSPFRIHAIYGCFDPVLSFYSQCMFSFCMRNGNFIANFGLLFVSEISISFQTLYCCFVTEMSISFEAVYY